MKVLVLLALLLTALPALAGEVHVQVNGLACPFCAYGLEKKLKPLAGVAGVQVPVVQNLNGYSLESDYVVTVGARWQH